MIRASEQHATSALEFLPSALEFSIFNLLWKKVWLKDGRCRFGDLREDGRCRFVDLRERDVDLKVQHLSLP